MRKKRWVFIVAFIISLSLLTACQTTTVNQEPTLGNETEDVETVDNEQPNENGTSDGTGSASPNQENDEDSGKEVEKDPNKEPKNDSENEVSDEGNVQAKRYKVNPNHFMIYPVTTTEDQQETDEKETKEEEKIVLLTFDDTPTAKATDQILDTLDKYNAKALFFVNGHYAEPNLDTLLDIKNRGHLIGNHTWWHVFLRKEDPETVRNEIVGLSDFLEEHLGERPKYFRPPFGQNSDVSLEVIKEEGMQTMNWSNGSLDWELKTPEAIAEQVLSNIKNGDNILFHDKQSTADALDHILGELTKQGYQFVLPTEVVLPGEE
jgi:peptidoglycan/xylan/chitin deacetylase (PgdA/CDA1 family)